MEDRWGTDLLRDDQEAQPAEGAADPLAAACHGERHGQHQPRQRRREPGQDAGGEKARADRHRDTDGDVPAVPAERVAPARPTGDAALRRPAGVLAGDDLVDLPGVNEHHDRRIERRDEDLGKEARDDRAGAAASCAKLADRQRPDDAEQLRQEQHDQGDEEQPDHPLRIEARPGGKELEVGGEIFRPDDMSLHGEREAADDERQPEERDGVAHHAHRHVDAVRHGEARGADHLQVLQVSLCPPPVPNGRVDQAGRALLPRAEQARGHLDAPAGAPHQAPPRRSHARGSGRRTACGRAGWAVRRTARRRRCGRWRCGPRNCRRCPARRRGPCATTGP